jgi:hypothetical protein
VLVACEYSGRVRDAFRARGHEALSCDLHPTEVEGPHHQGDVRELLNEAWDLVIAHPDCTFHTNASVRWFTTIPNKPKPGVFYGDARWSKWEEAVSFFQLFQNLTHVPKVAIENPIPHCYSRDALGDYTQVIQPWQFGHKEMKATCLWLKGLQPLQPTNIVGPPPRNVVERRKWAKCHQAPPGPNRWKERSRTYEGIAQAMAEQWG